MRVSTPESQRNDHQCKWDRAGNGDNDVNGLVAMVLLRPSWRDHDSGTWTLLLDG